MEKSKVYFTDLRTRPGLDLMTKMIRLVKAAGIESVDFDGKFTAIKIHFGEPGNLAYIRPNYAAKLVDYRREGRTLYYFLADDHVRTILGQGMEHIGENARH